MMISEEQFLEGVFKPFVDEDDENDKPAKRQKIGKLLSLVNCVRLLQHHIYT